MKVVGIVAEYNPFHKGHEYHIKKAKEITGADYVVVVMSGDYVQRGTPAILDKYTRTKMALGCGADLVLELPVCYATSSAEYFASTAVLLLNKLGIVDSICFGSECDDLGFLKLIAQSLLSEPDTYRQSLTSLLKKGHSYPVSRGLALSEYLSNVTDYSSDEILNVLKSPNNILGIEYLKAIYRYNCNIVPYTIARISADYHDETLHSHISSATAIRRELLQNGLTNEVLHAIPDLAKDFFTSPFNHSFPVIENDFSTLLQYKLLYTDSLSEYVDITDDLADRMKNQFNPGDTFTQMVKSIHTKQITRTRIQRCLLHLILDIKKETMNDFMDNGLIYYARILGFHRSASFLLGRCRKESDLPLINKMADAKDQLSPPGSLMFEQDVNSSHLYQMIVSHKFHTPFMNEYKRTPIIF